MTLTESVLSVPLQALVDGKLEISGLYKYCTMLFREFLTYYNGMVKLGRVDAIENLPQSDKKQLWDFSGTISDDKEERIKICKVSYIIDYMVTKNY